MASDGGSDASAQVRLSLATGRTPQEESEAPADGCVGAGAGAAADADGPTKFTDTAAHQIMQTGKVSQTNGISQRDQNVLVLAGQNLAEGIRDGGHFRRRRGRMAGHGLTEAGTSVVQ